MRAVIFAVIAWAGAAAEILLLHHELVESYPYKLMTYPPDHFYTTVASVSGIALLILSGIGATVTAAKWPEIAPAVITFLTPIASLLWLAIATTIFYGWTVPAPLHNFDDSTVADATLHYAKIALAYSAAGLIGGSIFSSAVTLALGIQPLRKDRKI